MKYTERQDGNQSERNLRRLFSSPTRTIRSAENVSEKALTIDRTNRFSRCGGTCGLCAIFYEPIGYQMGVSREIVKHVGILCTAGNFREITPAEVRVASWERGRLGE